MRAERRFRELVAKGHVTDIETVLEDVKARDERDSARAAAPLKPAEDSVVIDTSELTIAEAIAAAIGAIDARR